jgi:hypothetical protein
VIFDLQQPGAGGPSAVAGQMPPSGSSTAVPADPLPCISLWQPWAQWVLLGWKTIETRYHPRFETLAGKRIGIHAAKVWDKQAIHIARAWLNDDQIAQTYELLREYNALGGKVLGTVFVNEHRLLDRDDSPAALSECETVRYGLILRDPIKFEVPFPVTGRQGIFHVTIPYA